MGIFTSVFKEELVSFMDFIKLSVTGWNAYQRTLSDFDSFLHTEGLKEKKFDAGLLKRWFDGLTITLSTKKTKLSHEPLAKLFIDI